MTSQSGDALTGPDPNLEQMAALVEAGDVSAISAAIASLHPADLAELLNVLPRPDSRKTVFAMLQTKVAATVVTRLSPTARAEILASRSDDELRSLVEELPTTTSRNCRGSARKSRSSTHRVARSSAGCPGSD